MHICPEEILPVLAMLPFAGHFLRKLRTRWLARHKCADACPHNSATDCEESAHPAGPHHHSEDNQGAYTEAGLNRGTENPAS